MLHIQEVPGSSLSSETKSLFWIFSAHPDRTFFFFKLGHICFIAHSFQFVIP